MANLQIKGMDDGLYSQLKEVAASENRSISQEVQYLIKTYIARKKSFEKRESPAQTLLTLAGSWEDKKEADEIVKDLKNSRINSKKLDKGF